MCFYRCWYLLSAVVCVRGVCFSSCFFFVSPRGGKSPELFSQKTPRPRSKRPGVLFYACTITTPREAFASIITVCRVQGTAGDTYCIKGSSEKSQGVSRTEIVFYLMVSPPVTNVPGSLCSPSVPGGKVAVLDAHGAVFRGASLCAVSP